MQKAVDVMMTCVGRKSYLVEILENSDRCGSIVAVDADSEATIQFHAHDFHVVPPVVTKREAYIDALIELSARLEVDCVLPQNDLDLIPVAEARDRFHEHGIEIAGASADVTRAVGDKLEMADWMARHDLPYPNTWRPTRTPESELPAVIKSRRGQGSARFEPVEEANRLAEFDPEDVVVQQKIDGPEFNLDILRSSEGEIVAVVPKRKLEMRFGATNKAQSVEAPELIELGREIGRATRHVGSIDVDVMVEENTGDPWVLDINPRIGGGFPYTSHFCPRYVDALLAICNGEAPTPFLGAYRAGVRVDREFRYFEVASDR